MERNQTADQNSGSLDALVRLIEKVERNHFRTVHDTGANPCARLIWNIVRKEAGMKPITMDDLPAWCLKCKTYHVKPCQPEPNAKLRDAGESGVE